MQYSLQISPKVDDEKFPQDFIYVVHPEESKNVSVKRGLSTVNVCIKIFCY